MTHIGHARKVVGPSRFERRDGRTFIFRQTHTRHLFTVFFVIFFTEDDASKYREVGRNNFFFSSHCVSRAWLLSTFTHPVCFEHALFFTAETPVDVSVHTSMAITVKHRSHAYMYSRIRIIQSLGLKQTGRTYVSIMS